MYAVILWSWTILLTLNDILNYSSLKKRGFRGNVSGLVYKVCSPKTCDKERSYSSKFENKVQARISQAYKKFWSLKTIKKNRMSLHTNNMKVVYFQRYGRLLKPKHSPKGRVIGFYQHTQKKMLSSILKVPQRKKVRNI